MTDVSNLDNLAAAISGSSTKIRNYAIAQAAATQAQEADFQGKIAALDARLDALEAPEPPPPPPPPPPDPTRYVYKLGTSFGGNTSDTGWVRQYSGVAANITFDPSVDVMNALGCTSLKCVIPANEACVNGSNRAQLFSTDNIATSRGQPDFGMHAGEEWWYGFAFKTDAGYTPQNGQNPNWNSIFCFHPGAPYPMAGQHDISVWTKNEAGGGSFVPFTDGKPRLGVNIRGENAAGQTYYFSKADSLPFVPGQRYVVQWRMKWSDSGQGEVEVWIDGRNVVPTVTGVTNLAYGVPNEYPLFQSYRRCPALKDGVPITNSNTVWYGGLVKAATRAGVAIP